MSPYRLATRLLIQGALLSLGITLVMGLVAAVMSTPVGAAWFGSHGLDMRDVRPLHTVYGAAWPILAALAGLYHHLHTRDRPVGRTERWRLRIMVVSWTVAGAGILLSVPAGWTSGREYVGYHPIWSIPIAIGWACLCGSVVEAFASRIFSRPVYALMWVTGCLLFAWTFLEQHAWLLSPVFEDPIVDKRLQWKACGTLVGAFNFLIYGSLFRLGEHLTGDERYAHSRTAWALWYVSLANTLFNYTHHTYHLPQGHALKWWGFAVTMTETILVFKAVADLVSAIRSQQGGPVACRSLLNTTKGWTVFMLVSAILLSVPPLNALVHGSYLIVGHAMGGMIGIDTMAMLAVTAWLLAADSPRAGAVLDRPGLRTWIVATNVAVVAFVLWLHGVGLIDGVARYLAPSGGGFAHRSETWTTWTPPVLAVTGVLATIGLLGLTLVWGRLAFSAPAEARAPSRRAATGS